MVPQTLKKSLEREIFPSKRSALSPNKDPFIAVYDPINDDIQSFRALIWLLLDNMPFYPPFIQG